MIIFFLTIGVMVIVFLIPILYSYPKGLLDSLLFLKHKTNPGSKWKELERKILYFRHACDLFLMTSVYYIIFYLSAGIIFVIRELHPCSGLIYHILFTIVIFLWGMVIAYWYLPKFLCTFWREWPSDIARYIRYIRIPTIALSIISLILIWISALWKDLLNWILIVMLGMLFYYLIVPWITACMEYSPTSNLQKLMELKNNKK